MFFSNILTFYSKILTYLAGLDFIEDLWDGLTNVVQKVITFFGTLFTSIISLFWTSGSGDNAGLTMIGWLMLITLGVGLFWLAFRFIRGLISGMGRRR